jgi:iron(III) transport system permease protein
LQVNYWLGPTGIDWLQGWLGSLLAVALVHAFACIPWVSLIISLGLINCDRNEEEMAIVDGGWLMLVRHVWLPRLRIWLWVACLWCAMGILTEMVVSNLYMFPTVAELVYMDVSRDTISPLTYLSAVTLCALPVFALGLWISRGLPSLSLVLTKPLHHQAAVISLGPRRWIASVLMWSLLAILVGLPLLNIVMKSGWTPLTDGHTVVGHSFTLRRFLQTIYESLTLFQTQFYWSALLSVGSMVTALATSGLLYWATSTAGELKQFGRRGLVHLAMLLMVAIPGPLVGIIIAQLLNRPGFLGQLYITTLAAPIIAQQFRLLPLAWLIVCGLIASIPRQTWDLARSDGLSQSRTLRTVLMPAIGARLAVAAVILMLVSVGELSCSMGVLPPGVTTTSMRLFEILHFGMRHQDSGLCGVLFVLGWLAAILMRWTTRNT